MHFPTHIAISRLCQKPSAQQRIVQHRLTLMSLTALQRGRTDTLQLATPPAGALHYSTSAATNLSVLGGWFAIGTITQSTTEKARAEDLQRKLRMDPTLLRSGRPGTKGQRVVDSTVWKPRFAMCNASCTLRPPVITSASLSRYRITKQGMRRRKFCT